MKNLFKTLFIVTALILGSTMQSQAQETKRLFKKYRKAKGVMGMSVNGVIVDFAIGVSDMDKETKRALKKMTKGVGFIVMEDSDHRAVAVVVNGKFTKDDARKLARAIDTDGKNISFDFKN